MERILRITPVRKTSDLMCRTLDGRFAGRIESARGGIAKRLAARPRGAVSRAKIKGGIVEIFMDGVAFAAIWREQENGTCHFHSM